MSLAKKKIKIDGVGNLCKLSTLNLSRSPDGRRASAAAAGQPTLSQLSVLTNRRVCVK